MKPVVTPGEMAAADRRAIAAGTPETVLVERAGRAVARVALEMLGGAYGRRVVVVCGKGNNGADGHVAARVLRDRGIGVDLFSLADGVEASRLTRAIARADLAIDAMFGTGFRGALDGDAALTARAMADVRTLAVDTPSGVDGTTGEVRGTAVRAEATVCFVALKPGVLFEPGRSRAGRVHIVDIGIDPGPSSLHVLDIGDLWLPRRPAESHKWSAGALIVGGSTGLFGAPLMASHAAARSGAGMVVCALPGADAAARASGSEIVTRALDTHIAADVLKEIDRFRVLAIGPGIGRDADVQAAVRQIVSECPIPVVVDADALNALAGDLSPLQQRVAAQLPPAVLTPHAGEYARLAGAPVGADRVASARDLAARARAIVLLKGPGTVIASPAGDAIVNRTDTPALATAGTGDVLTGIIAGLVANGASPFVGGATGAFVHGCTATTAGTGHELVAPDLVDALHETFEVLRAS
jgi:ADP-dependent NAD(P)H-hydrate dehydratase / NAD(P)H-hydrate epimerase